MEKHRQYFDEPSPSVDGPDYVALVIEWDDIADAMETKPIARGTAGAARSTMSQPGQDRECAEGATDCVDQASMDSFPASDPPAWGSSHAVATPGVPEDLNEEITSPFEAKPVGSFKRFMLGFAALAAMISMVEGLRRLRHA